MLYTSEQIQLFLSDPAAQTAASQEVWTDMLASVASVYADKPVTMMNFRHKLTNARKQVRAAAAPPKPAKPQPTVVQHAVDPSAKYVCRICGAPLAPTSKAVMAHYEKRHYSDFVRNRTTMDAHPQIFLVRK